MANAPLNTQGTGVQISTVVHPSRTGPDPLYGMPRNFGVGGSGHTQQPPPYIDGIGPLGERRDFSGPYTDDDTDSSVDTYPRRRHRDKEPATQTRSRNDNSETRSLMEQIREHEYKIEKLKRDMEAARQNRQTIPKAR